MEVIYKMTFKFLNADAVRQAFLMGGTHNDIAELIADELTQLQLEQDAMTERLKIEQTIVEYNKKFNAHYMLAKVDQKVAPKPETWTVTMVARDRDAETLKNFTKNL